MGREEKMTSTYSKGGSLFEWCMRYRIAIERAKRYGKIRASRPPYGQSFSQAVMDDDDRKEEDHGNQ